MTRRFRAGSMASILAALLALLGAAPGTSPTPATPLENGRLISVSAVHLRPGLEARPEFAPILKDVDVSSITYASDGLKVKGYLAVPKIGEHLPAVIWNRGGNRPTEDLDAVSVLGALARRGFVVVASQYRGTAGGEGRAEFGGADVDDVLNLIPLLEAQPRADASRIGMVGWSRGGMMTYLALTRTDRIAAAVVASGISDLFDWLEKRRDMQNAVTPLIRDFKGKKEEALAARSAIRWPEKLAPKTPILILAGTADYSVNAKQSIDMAAALLAIHHPFRLVVFEGGGHELREHKEELDRLIGDWLDRYVRDRKPVPGLVPRKR